MIKTIQEEAMREELGKISDELLVAELQVSSLQREIQNVRSDVLLERRNQLHRIIMAKSRLLELFSTVASEDTVTRNDFNETLRQRDENFQVPLLVVNMKISKPVMMANAPAAPTVGPIESRAVETAIGPVEPHREHQTNTSNISSIHKDLLPVCVETNLSTESSNKCIPDVNIVKILDIKPNGKCIQLCNSSDAKDFNLSNCWIQQEISGHPVVVFRFPHGSKILSRKTIAVWSDGNLSSENVQPADFVLHGLEKWGVGPHFKTLFCSPDGQVLDHWTATHRHLVPIAFSTPNNKRDLNTCKRRAVSASPCNRISRPTFNNKNQLIGHTDHSGCKDSFKRLQRPLSSVLASNQLK